MTFITRPKRGRLPVALGAEAVARGHQPLHGHPGQLHQPVQVFEGVGEGPETAGLEEMPQSQLGTGRIIQRRAMVAAVAEGRGQGIKLLVLGHQAIDLGVGDFGRHVPNRRTNSLTP